ncbi:MAG: hypothetical protein K2Y28_11435 [Burkholderiaceae bacterium]|nr:hypothetical protein [Burkholderiaceae bacterium]
MRDPNRIPVVLDALRRVWERQPDLRLGQLIVIATRPDEPCLKVFNIEEAELLAGLSEYENQLPSID